ncbi:MAG: hypothetical protein ACI4V1_01515, partial [Eubacteriales bacterium]
LYVALLVLWLILTMVNALVRTFVLNLLALAVLIFAMYRCMSRKHDRRRRENAAFLRFWHPVRNWFTYQRDRIRDRKTARYRKCSHCKAIVKLPVKKGKHTVVCPRCHERFDVRI